jgi:2-dehydropantoate 2-reductase
MMKIAVMGAGAVGCYFGAILARAGDKVTLIGRQQHVDVITKTGLVLEMHGQVFNIPVQASTEPAGIASADIVLFCVKSGATENAGRAMQPYLGQETVIISLQNSVDNATRLQAVLGREVIASVVHVAAEMTGPGRVRHHGSGRLTIGTAPESNRVAAHFNQSNLPTEISDNVAGALWGKLIVNCAYNAVSAITQLPYGRIAQSEGARQMMRDVTAECLAVAEWLGVRVPGDPWAVVEQIPVVMPEQISSTAHDVARRQPSEIDYLNGYVVAHAAALGVPAPVNNALHAMVKLIEAKGS